MNVFGFSELVPGPLCPNCLAPMGWIETGPDNMRHWIADHGDWSCIEAPEEERRAAGYLVTLEYTEDGPSATKSGWSRARWTARRNGRCVEGTAWRMDTAVRRARAAYDALGIDHP